MYGQPDEWGAEYHTPAVRPPPSAKDALVERYCEQLRHAPTVARPELSPAYLDPSERSVASSKSEPPASVAGVDFDLLE